MNRLEILNRDDGDWTAKTLWMGGLVCVFQFQGSKKLGKLLIVHSEITYSIQIGKGDPEKNYEESSRQPPFPTLSTSEIMNEFRKWFTKMTKGT